MPLEFTVVVVRDFAPLKWMTFVSNFFKGTSKCTFIMNVILLYINQ